ncbi:hypothetical protein WT15_00020 [Burkholderia stagnalis]|nr:hypothetical protein WT15_00020 [Burkholderia stagnalis]KWK15164.1 hypothetical protein WT76_32005 [Burkholderia stagnalis]KWO36661.1 hypothetical protein WT96_13435 [Burkholderia stagnalis]KWO44587.1 hypothetical protein WT95_27760 [Burkholderia stagnalis]
MRTRVFLQQVVQQRHGRLPSEHAYPVRVAFRRRKALCDESHCEPLYLWLRITGRWLAHDASFQAGQKLRVHVEHGKLTITAT